MKLFAIKIIESQTTVVLSNILRKMVVLETVQNLIDLLQQWTKIKHWTFYSLLSLSISIRVCRILILL